MARVAGIAYLKVDGTQYDLAGNFTVSPSMIQRQMLAGQDGVHGYEEMPRVPFIEGDIRLAANLTVAQLDAMTDVTVTAELANGLTVILAAGRHHGRAHDLDPGRHRACPLGRHGRERVLRSD